MTDLVYDLIAKIDQKLSRRFTGKFYGLCEVVNGPGERYPVTCVAKKRERVNPADTWQLQTYHTLGSVVQLPTEDNFGRDITLQQDVTLTVIANVSLGEYLIHKIAKALPDLVRSTHGYSVLENGYTINTDHQSIAVAEFGNIPEDKHRLQKNIWQIGYTLNITECIPVQRFTPCNWILELGRWDDGGCWKDIAIWID
jgi:hypothetical protein